MDVAGRRGNTRGQSSPLGLALVFAIVIVGTISIVALGSAALTDAQHDAELGQAEHSMSQFDSLASQVALGDSPVQTLTFGQSGGTYSVDPDAGRIVVVHTNHDGGTEDGDLVDDDVSGDDDEEIYNSTLGAVTYSNGDDVIAYQGGGVWRQERTGSSRMVSPPEFHYRDATLTLPLLRVNPGGSGDGASGSPTVTVRRQSEVKEVFPDSSRAYGDDNGDTFANPQANGTMVIKVESQYYEGWAEYFRTRTAGEVRSFDSNETVMVELISLGTGQGDFQMPRSGNPIEIRGLKTEGHALDTFEIELRPDDTDSANFANLQWSLHADQGNKEFEIHLKKGSSADCGSQTVDVSMYYSEDDGDTYHGWKSEDALTVQCDADGHAYLLVDLATLTAPIEYQELQNDDVEVNKPQQGELIPTAQIDEHGDDGISWEPDSYSATDTEETGRLFSHYMALLGPDFDLYVEDKGSDTVSESHSSGTMNYAGTGQFVTFLHVSENDISVEFD